MSYDVRFLKGIRANYDALPVKDANTFYYVDETDLYLGEILLSNAAEVAEAVQSIELNAQAIKTLQDELDALVDPEGTGGGSISTQINTLRTELTALITANTEAIETEASRAKGIESGLRTDVNNISGELSTLKQTVADNESDIEGKISQLSTTVQGNTTEIGLVKNIALELSPRVGTLEGEMDTVQAAIEALVGEDAEKSVREIAYEELAAALVPAEAAESLDTLEEIAAWIQSHPEDASAMNAAIQALQGSDSTQNGKITSLEEAVAAINNAESGILAQAKGYTDTKVSEISGKHDALALVVEGLQEDVEAIEDAETGILAKAEEAILEAIQNLGLGTAAYENIDYFERAGAAEAAAATALNEAKAYTNEALTWGVIPAQSAE